MDDEWLHRFHRSWEEDRLRFDAMREETRDHFRRLYDLIQERGERMDRHFAQIQAVLKDHARRLLVLEGRTITRRSRKR